MKKQKDYWSKEKNNLPKSYKKWLSLELNYLSKIINKNDIVLDFGCGFDGRILATIEKKTKEIYGVDININAIKTISKKFSYTFKKSNGENLPFEDNYFNIVILAGNTFGNLENSHNKVLLEMKRVLKGGGKIFISVFNEYAYDERVKLYEKYSADIKEIKGTTVYFDSVPGSRISRQFTEKEIRKTLSFYFKKIEIRKEGISYICIAEK